MRLALNIDENGYKNSIMTFNRIRYKDLKQLENKRELLYKKITML